MTGQRRRRMLGTSWHACLASSPLMWHLGAVPTLHVGRYVKGQHLGLGVRRSVILDPEDPIARRALEGGDTPRRAARRFAAMSGLWPTAVAAIARRERVVAVRVVVERRTPEGLVARIEADSPVSVQPPRPRRRPEPPICADCFAIGGEPHTSWCGSESIRRRMEDYELDALMDDDLDDWEDDE